MTQLASETVKEFVFELESFLQKGGKLCSLVMDVKNMGRFKVTDSIVKSKSEHTFVFNEGEITMEADTDQYEDFFLLDEAFDSEGSDLFEFIENDYVRIKEGKLKLS